jgi:hypothetical protein
MKIKDINFYQLSRQNTGSHMCDSGGAYGYHYQRPMDKRRNPVRVEGKGNEVRASISLPAFLTAVFTIDQGLTRMFREWAEKRDESWYESFPLWLKELGGYATETETNDPKIQGDNSYNHDNDLNQDFQCHYAVKDRGKEPYGDNALYMVQTHNGCDVRGGYSTPVICRCETYEDWANSMDFTCGWYGWSGTRNKVKLTREELSELTEHYSCGWSSAPSYELSKNMKRVVRVNHRKPTVTVELVTGEIVTLAPEVSWEW